MSEDALMILLLKTMIGTVTIAIGALLFILFS